MIEDLQAIGANLVQLVARLARVVDQPTAGPLPHPAGADPAAPPTNHGAALFVDGWWCGARHVPAHRGRVGGPIHPFATVVHTTDMLPDEWSALLAAWTTRAGEGACAHFLIGRDAAHGVVQFVPLDHNGNHAGGPGGGMFVVNGRNVHPNTVTVGIEIHCAGGVRLVGGQWRLVEDGKAHGAPLPASDVIPDPARPGRGWHVMTEYQRTTLLELLADLDASLWPLPAGTTTKAFGEVPPKYSIMPTARVVTHAQLDPVHRADPWPPVCDVLRNR